MDGTSILSKRVKKIITLKVLVIFSALLSLYSTSSLATQNTAKLVDKTTITVQETPWKTWRKDDYFKVSYRINNLDNLIEIKALAKFESSLAGFIYFIEDLAMTPRWLVNAKSAEIINQIAINECIFITRFERLWPFSAREMVVHSRYWQNEDLSVEIAVKDAGNNIAKNKNVIRMQVITAHWKIIPVKPNQIALTYQFKVDPKGNIPLWLAKPMTLNSIWTSLNNIKAQLPKSKYQHQTKADIQEIQHKQ